MMLEIQDPPEMLIESIEQIDPLEILFIQRDMLFSRNSIYVLNLGGMLVVDYNPLLLNTRLQI